MPNARILLFGYNSNVAFGSTNATIFDHASSLLSLLSEKRQATKAESRLLLFVAHSLGGLVVKQASSTLSWRLHPIITDNQVCV